MGQCASSSLTTDDSPMHRYQGAWQPSGLGDGLANQRGNPHAYRTTTTANVGLGRGEERVFLHDPSPGALQLPLQRIEEDQALQGQDSPTKPQASAASQSANRRDLLLNWTKGELIGQGAFGSVYLGMDNDTGQLMAVKQVTISKAAERGKVSEHLKELEAEVHLLQQLDQANIVRYLGTERTETALNIFLEYVPGGSIASLLAKFGSFRESVIKVYTKQILLGLEYLHKHGIMHRDIKGANILVDNTGLVKLADFGASKKIEDLVTIDSGFKSVKGTPYWMAPEVIKQSGHGRQADIWSVACTVIEMATGKPPWSQYGSQVSAMFHIASSKGPPTIPDSLSADCKDFLYLCFNRNYKERPSASRLLQHPFLADVVCRTVAAPLNNIANMVQEPAIKAWRVPKDVRVPSPMRDESEGVPFSTPSPMHPRLLEKATGGARISITTSQATAADGEQTPGTSSKLALSPLGTQVAVSRRDPQPLPQAPAAAGRMQQQQQRSPTKRQSSVRSSAPTFGGYASMALTPRAPLEPLVQFGSGQLGSSTASTVHPRAALTDSQQLLLQQQPSGGLTRESSLAADATLRVSNSSLRASREAAVTVAPVQLNPLGDAEAYKSLRPLVAEAAMQETPAPVKRGAQDLIQFPNSCGRASGSQDSSTPSTGDSRGTVKSDYNPMEEPSWMHAMESPLETSSAPRAGARSPSKPAPLVAPQPTPSTAPALDPLGDQPQRSQQEQAQQHMVWMDDDGSIDQLPWDMGSWSVGSGDASPAGEAPTQPVGEPVGQDVLITALNRRAHLEVRASLALFSNVLKESLNVNKEATPSPKGARQAAQPGYSPPRVAPAGSVSLAAAGAGAKLALAAAPGSKEDWAAVVQPAPLPAAGAYQMSRQPEEGGPTFGGRFEAVWEQELQKELSQLPSAAQWRYQSGHRRISMHGSPMKLPQQ